MTTQRTSSRLRWLRSPRLWFLALVIGVASLNAWRASATPSTCIAPECLLPEGQWTAEQMNAINETDLPRCDSLTL